MYLVQLLLPVSSPKGKRMTQRAFDVVCRELTQQFGGVTAYFHSPASGLWRKRGSWERDRVILVEVMANHFHRVRWVRYRRLLEKRFQQEEIAARVLRIDKF